VERADHSISTSARDRGKHFTTIDVSRRARSGHIDEKQLLLLLPLSKSGGG